MKQVQEQEQNQTGREPSHQLPSANTLRAEVLAVLLASEDMAGLESAFAKKGATRLSTVVRALTRRYGWPIERHEFAANTVDGRAAWVSMYCLPPEAITRALELGAAGWIDEVKASRYKRHRQAGKQQRLAGVLSPSMGDGRSNAG
jgi:hypothetical protein